VMLSLTPLPFGSEIHGLLLPPSPITIRLPSRVENYSEDRKRV
jgi:hypothetical protein